MAVLFSYILENFVTSMHRKSDGCTDKKYQNIDPCDAVSQDTRVGIEKDRNRECTEKTAKQSAGRREGDSSERCGGRRRDQRRTGGNTSFICSHVDSLTGLIRPIRGFSFDQS